MIALVLASSLAAAQAPQGPLVQALEAELERSVSELSLPGAPPIYHLRYQALQLDQVEAIASFGQRVHYQAQPLAALGIELRVGSPDFDNTGFGGWQNGFGLAGLPVRTTPAAARIEAWALSDRAYKQAVEQLARKEAQFEPPEDYPGDYTLTGATVADLGRAAPGDGPSLAALAEEVSAALVSTPVLERGEVHVGHEAGSLLVLDSEGTRVRLPRAETTVRLVAHHRADDGMLLTDHLLWTVRDPADLPGRVMADRARDVAASLADLAEAPVLDEEYVGPVVFQDSAAPDLFRYLLVPQVEGTPPEVPFESWFGSLGGERDQVRLLRRVLPPGWSAVDDPTSRLEHPAGFRRDMEGSPAEAVHLVEDGVVRDLLMSRVPRKGLDRTNGHARGRPGRRSEGRAAVLTVTPDRRASDRRIHRRALRMAGSYDRDWYLAVRRLQEPAVRSVGQGFGALGDDRASLPPPVAVVRVHADGTEEVLRGAAFSGVERWVLRDLVAAGDQVSTSYMAPFDGHDYRMMDPTEGMPTWLSAPEVLVGELEVVPVQGDARDIPAVPPPAP